MREQFPGRTLTAETFSHIGNGLAVGIAENGAICIERVEKQTVRSRVHGIQMPEMDGPTATRRLRDDPRFKNLPVVVMTAYAFAVDREKGSAAGMVDYVTKPLDPRLVCAALARWIPPQR